MIRNELLHISSWYLRLVNVLVMHPAHQNVIRLAYHVTQTCTSVRTHLKLLHFRVLLLCRRGVDSMEMLPALGDLSSFVALSSSMRGISHPTCLLLNR